MNAPPRGLSDLLRYTTHTVMHNKMPSVNEDLYAVSRGDANAVARGFGSLGVHAKGLYFRVPCPRAVAAVAGALYSS